MDFAHYFQDIPLVTIPTRIATALLILLGFTFLSWRPKIPKTAPPLVKGQLPVVGAIGFLSARQRFFKYWSQRSPSGNFSFYVGKKPVVGLSGDEARKFFVENRSLGAFEGNALQFGTVSYSTPVKDEDGNNTFGTSAFGTHFNSRLAQMMRRQKLAANLEVMLSDVRQRFNDFGESGITDPFDSIYLVIFQLAMRTLGVKEIGDDMRLLVKARDLFWTVYTSFTPMTVLFPWFPSLGLLKRFYAGAKIKYMLYSILSSRSKSGKKENDPLQFLVDQGEELNHIIAVVVGALVTGQISTGVITPWTLIYLTQSPTWTAEIHKEINSVADKYCHDKSMPLVDRLASIPLEGWENDFPIIDLCTRDAIRIQMVGSGFRKNITGRDIEMDNGEVIPKDCFVAYHFDDVFMNPEIYPNPDRWDPSRYLPERSEDTKRPYAAVHWGAARHPCPGMKFAKLEMTIVIAFWLTMFDYELCDETGIPTERLPITDRQEISAHRPKERVTLKYRRRALTVA